MRSPGRKACLTFRKERGKFRAMASHPHNASGDADQLVPVPPELIAVVKIGVRAHREVPGSVAVGGTVCALFAHHRVSIDVDFVVSDLAYDRDVTRDFVDFAELACLLDADTVVDALAVLDEKFTWEKQPSVVLEVTKALLCPDPHDYEMRGFEAMRFLKPRLRTWSAVVEKCRDIGRRLSLRLLGGSADAT